MAVRMFAMTGKCFAGECMCPCFLNLNLHVLGLKGAALKSRESPSSFRRCHRAANSFRIQISSMFTPSDLRKNFRASLP